MLDYPYFIDVRPDGMAQDVAITASLPQLTMAWSSPIVVAQENNANRQVTALLRSTENSWLSTDTNIMPQMDERGLNGFVPTGEAASHTLAVMVEGRFDSFFAGQPSPLLEAPAIEAAAAVGEEEAASQPETPADTLGVVSGVIDRSPESARLFVFSSNDFLADQILRMIGSAEGIIYANSVQLMAHVVDWTLEDRSLLSIRARGHFNRTLPPLTQAAQALLEYLNYTFAVAGVLAVFLLHRRRMAGLRAEYRNWLVRSET